MLLMHPSCQNKIFMKTFLKNKKCQKYQWLFCLFWIDPPPPPLSLSTKIRAITVAENNYPTTTALCKKSRPTSAKSTKNRQCCLCRNIKELFDESERCNCFVRNNFLCYDVLIKPSILPSRSASTMLKQDFVLIWYCLFVFSFYEMSILLKLFTFVVEIMRLH